MIKNKIWKKINYMPNYLISNFGDVINIKTNKTLKHQIKKGYHRLEVTTIYGRKHFLFIDW